MRTRTAAVVTEIWNRIKDLPGFTTVTQVPQPFAEVNESDMPYMYMESSQAALENTPGLPPKTRLTVNIGIYCSHGMTSGGTIPPTEVMNPLIDTVVDVFSSDHDNAYDFNCTGECCDATQTLGGLVDHCWVTNWETGGGSLQNLEVAQITLEVLY